MTEIKITITAPDLSEAINNLAAALAGKAKAEVPQTGAAPVIAPTVQQQTGAVPGTTAVQQQAATGAQQGFPMNPSVTQQNPVQAAQTVTPGTGTGPAPVNHTPAPTAQKTYTLDDLSLAAAALIDAGKMQSIMAIIQKYGVPAINLLRQDQYAAFADDLRAIGGKI